MRQFLYVGFPSLFRSLQLLIRKRVLLWWYLRVLGVLFWLIRRFFCRLVFGVIGAIRWELQATRRVFLVIPRRWMFPSRQMRSSLFWWFQVCWVVAFWLLSLLLFFVSFLRLSFVGFRLLFIWFPWRIIPVWRVQQARVLVGLSSLPRMWWVGVEYLSWFCRFWRMAVWFVGYWPISWWERGVGSLVCIFEFSIVRTAECLWWRVWGRFSFHLVWVVRFRIVLWIPTDLVRLRCERGLASCGWWFWILRLWIVRSICIRCAGCVLCLQLRLHLSKRIKPQFQAESLHIEAFELGALARSNLGAFLWLTRPF